MKKFLPLLALIPMCFAAHAAPASHAAAAVVVMGGASAAASNQARVAGLAQQSGCASCHQEIYPFSIPPAAFARDCFEFGSRPLTSIIGEVEVLSRECGKIRRVYSYRPFYSHAPTYYYLPAEEKTFNPHYLLKEGEE